MIQEGRVTPFYKLEAMLGIEDERIEKASDLSLGDYLRVSMQSSGYQPVLSGKLHPYWEAALKDGGTSQITVIGVESIPQDYSRLT